MVTTTTTTDRQTQAQCSSLQNNMVTMAVKLSICVEHIVILVEQAHCSWWGCDVVQCTTVVHIVPLYIGSWWNTGVHIVYNRAGGGVLQRGGRVCRTTANS